MSAEGKYITEYDVNNWDVPAGLEEEFTTTAVNTTTDQLTLSHDVDTGTEISFSTTSELPADLQENCVYYAINVDSTHIQIATSPMNANAGNAVDITDTGSGTHTIRINWSQTFATTDVDVDNDKITVTHDIDTACKLRFGSSESTPGLPAPLEEGVSYYAINVDAAHIKVATTPANAIAGTAITITDVGTGTHSLYVGEGQTEYDRQQIINRVESLIENITKDFFTSTSFTIYSDGNGSDYLDLGLNADVLTVTEIKVAGVALDSSWWTYNTEAVYLDPDAVSSDIDDVAELHFRLRYKRCLFPEGTQNIKITGTYGHSSVPARVKEAAIILCKAENDSTLYKKFDTRLKSEKLGDYAYTLADSSSSKSLTGILEADELLKDYIKNKPGLGAV